MKNTVFFLSVLASCSLFGAVPSYETLICHRGESFDAPENTLPAYKMAVERGFGFECDIYLTKDGRIITFHDGSLTRTTGGACKKSCGEVTWDEVSQIDVGSWGKWKDSKFAGTRTALLEEVLELARDGRKIYVEIKTGPKIVPYIKDVLAKQTKATPKNIVFISFNASSCAEVKKLMPEYPVYFLIGNGFKPKDGEWRPWTAEEIIEKTKDAKADGVDICYYTKAHTAEFIEKVHQAGLGFHVWTVDNAFYTKEAFARGADTLTTNCAKRQLDEISAEAIKAYYERLAQDAEKKAKN